MLHNLYSKKEPKVMLVIERHSYGTLLVRNGVPLKDIQIWLGHSNFQTTLRYAHADVENKRISANVMENKLALDTKKEQITKLAL